MAEPSPGAARIVTISPDAGLDLSAIYTQTAQTWGQAQAERYDDFLEESFLALAQRPLMGRLVADRPGLRSYIAKWRNARQGHRIFYREINDGIYIVRVLHTAMNRPHKSVSVCHLPDYIPLAKSA